jgi:hypothetical protein
MKDHPVGRCIYCGSADPPLTDEHIIPEGLGGRELLYEASCKRCEKITGNFEQKVMRDSAWALRRALGMRGMKRKLPRTIPIRSFGRDRVIRASHTPPHEVGFKAALPVFQDPPGFLTGREPNDQTLVNVMLFFDETALSLRKPINPVLRVDPSAFARMFAKIAHAHAVELLGLDGLRLSFRMSSWADIQTGRSWSAVPRSTTRRQRRVSATRRMCSVSAANTRASCWAASVCSPKSAGRSTTWS